MLVYAHRRTDPLIRNELDSKKLIRQSRIDPATDATELKPGGLWCTLTALFTKLAFFVQQQFSAEQSVLGMPYQRDRSALGTLDLPTEGDIKKRAPKLGRMSCRSRPLVHHA